MVERRDGRGCRRSSRVPLLLAPAGLPARRGLELGALVRTSARGARGAGRRAPAWLLRRTGGRPAARRSPPPQGGAAQPGRERDRGDAAAAAWSCCGSAEAGDTVRIEVSDTGRGMPPRRLRAARHPVLHHARRGHRARRRARARRDRPARRLARLREQPGRGHRRDRHACRARPLRGGRAMARVLLVDDEPAVLFALREVVRAARPRAGAGALRAARRWSSSRAPTRW